MGVVNPTDTGTFDTWITNRMSFTVVPSKVGVNDNGDFEKWITDRVYWQQYTRLKTIYRVTYLRVG